MGLSPIKMNYFYIEVGIFEGKVNNLSNLWNY